MSDLRIVLASNNAKKLQELQALLGAGLLTSEVRRLVELDLCGELR